MHIRLQHPYKPDDAGKEFRRYADAMPEQTLKTAHAETGLLDKRFNPAYPMVAQNLLGYARDGIHARARCSHFGDAFVRDLDTLLKSSGVA